MSTCAARPAARLLVLDYDDTLCPSSWIAAQPDRQATERDLAILRLVEDTVTALLTRADALGMRVVIITNADEDWVRFSSQRFLPRIVPLLARVRVVSARQYEALYPGRSVCWKAAAFTHVAKAFFAEPHCEALGAREVISVGDSNDERLAVRAAAAPLDAVPKAVKLVDAPSLHTIACQLHTVATCLPFVAQAEHALDVDVAAILAYVGGAPPREGPVGDVLQKVWQDASWGLLTAIRFQSTAPPATAQSPEAPPQQAPASPSQAVAALA